MPRHKPKRFVIAKEARKLAREMTGLPPGSRVTTDKRRKLPKHKKALIERELLDSM